MMTPFPPKTPAQMRREAEHGSPLTPQQKREIEARHPQLGGGDNDRDDEYEATADWLGHIRAGRIEVR